MLLGIQILGMSRVMSLAEDLHCHNILPGWWLEAYKAKSEIPRATETVFLRSCEH